MRFVVYSKDALRPRVLKVHPEQREASEDWPRADEYLRCSDPRAPGGYELYVLRKHIFVLPDEEAAVRKAVEDSIQKQIQQHERSIAKLRQKDVDQILADVKEEYRKQAQKESP